MLRIQTVSGEGLVVLDLVSFHDTLPADVGPVRALKQHLSSICGLSRFRQRLMSLGDGAVLDGDHSLRAGEIQVVFFLNFCPASGMQVAQLLDAARSGRTSEMETLLHRPQKPDLGPATPLGVAAGHGHLQVIRLLLEANADKDKATPGGATPLYIAAKNGHLEVVRLLLEANADKDKAFRDGATPLFMAAYSGQLEVVVLLLEAKADKDKTMNDGRTPLFIAAQNGHLEVVRLLLEAKADKDKAHQDGTTPVCIADQNEHFEVLQVLRIEGQGQA